MQHLGIFGRKDKQRISYPVFGRIITIFGESTGVVTNLQDNNTFFLKKNSNPPSHNNNPCSHTSPSEGGDTLKPLPEKKILISKGTLTTTKVVRLLNY